MNSREVKRLEKYCIEHGLDPQLIDNSISYSENMDNLEQFTIGEEPELAEIKALEEWYNAQSYAETFGTEAFKDGRLPPIFHRTVIHFNSRRRTVRFGRTRWGQPIQHSGNVHPKKVILARALRIEVSPSPIIVSYLEPVYYGFAVSHCEYIVKVICHDCCTLFSMPYSNVLGYREDSYIL